MLRVTSPPAVSPLRCRIPSRRLTSSSSATSTTATGATSLRYDTTGGQFIYIWKTPTGAGSCYNVTITADDGSSQTAFFKLK
jgi:hypothetical protein